MHLVKNENKTIEGSELSLVVKKADEIFVFS